MEIKCFNVLSSFSNTSVYTVLSLATEWVYEGVLDRRGEAVQICIISECFKAILGVQSVLLHTRPYNSIHCIQTDNVQWMRIFLLSAAIFQKRIQLRLKVLTYGKFVTVS